MPSQNINAGASGNPLDTLLAGRSQFGSAGGMLTTFDPSTQTNGGFGGSAYGDPRFYTRNPVQSSEGGGETGMVLNDQTQTALNGRVQIRNNNIGGPGGVKDPSLVTYDPQYGMITDPSNLNAIDQTGTWIPGALLAAAGAGVGAEAMGLIGPGAGAATGGLDAGTTGAFDVGGSSGFGGSTALSGGEAGAAGAAGEAGGAAGGAAPATDAQMNAAISGAGGSTGGASGGSSLMGQLNTGRSILGGVSALTGGAGGSSSSAGGTGMGSGALGSIMSILGLGGLARQGGLIGGGVGTPSGATAAGQQAANTADPWGASGLRTQAQGMLTPGVMMNLLGLNPGGVGAQVQADPGFQFAQQQGVNAINMGDAAGGTLNSGNRGYELAQYGTGLASQYATQRQQTNLSTLGTLSGMAGMTGSNPAAAGQLQSGAFGGATSLQNSGINGLLGTLLNGGGAGGAGSIGSILSGLGGGLSSILSGGGNAIGSFFSSLFGGSGGSSSDSALTSDILGSIGGGSDLGSWANAIIP